MCAIQHASVVLTSWVWMRRRLPDEITAQPRHRQSKRGTGTWPANSGRKAPGAACLAQLPAHSNWT